jgi:hypothetical protein
MDRQEDLINPINAVIKEGISQKDQEDFQEISAAVEGYSRVFPHYFFFKTILKAFKPSSILVLGVYMGRDICLLSRLAERYIPEKTIRIVGVDKFSDTPCDDWTQDQKQQHGWKEAGFGKFPEFELAKSNVKNHATQNVELIRAHDQHFLSECSERFDFIYIDTSHDYETVARQLRQVKHCTKGLSIVAGDDYSDQNTWGVIKAVKENTSWHAAFQGWIWVTQRAWII